MSAPTIPARWQQEQQGKAETVEDLMRRAFETFDQYGVNISPSKLSRVIRAHIRTSGNLHQAGSSLDTFCLSYADPTGETAVRHIMAAGSAGDHSAEILTSENDGLA